MKNSISYSVLEITSYGKKGVKHQEWVNYHVILNTIITAKVSSLKNLGTYLVNQSIESY